MCAGRRGQGVRICLIPAGEVTEEARERQRPEEVLPGENVDASGRFSVPGQGTPKSRLPTGDDVNYFACD